MSLLICKFGGTSVGSVDALRQASEIVRQQISRWDRVVVVVSAMAGTTDALLSAAAAAADDEESRYNEIIDEIHQRHTSTLQALLPDQPARQELEGEIDRFIQYLRNFCRSIHVLGEVTPRGTDLISSLGERMCARIFSRQLENLGVHSTALDAT